MQTNTYYDRRRNVSHYGEEFGSGVDVDERKLQQMIDGEERERKKER